MDSSLLLLGRTEPPRNPVSYDEFLSVVNSKNYPELVPNALPPKGYYRLLPPYNASGSKDCFGTPYGYVGVFTNAAGKDVYVRHLMHNLEDALDQLTGKVIVLKLEGPEQFTGGALLRNGGQSKGGQFGYRGYRVLEAIYHDTKRDTTRIISPSNRTPPEDYEFL